MTTGSWEIFNPPLIPGMINWRRYGPSSLPPPRRSGAARIWTTIVTINDALKAVGYGLLVLFFAMGIFQSAVSFRDFQRPEFVLRHFIRFLLAKVAVGSAMDIMTAIFSVCGSVVQTVMGSVGRYGRSRRHHAPGDDRHHRGRRVLWPASPCGWSPCWAACSSPSCRLS